MAFKGIEFNATALYKHTCMGNYIILLIEEANRIDWNSLPFELTTLHAYFSKHSRRANAIYFHPMKIKLISCRIFVSAAVAVQSVFT